jgi:hypothetical protein
MADNNTNNAQAQDQPPRPNPALRGLDRLVGTWNVSGPHIRAQVTFEWMEGGFFLMQHVDLVHGGKRHRGIEYIGCDHDSDSLGPPYFGNSESLLEYEWEVDEDTLTIWFGRKGSQNVFNGVFGEDGNSCSGRWAWPGGAYESTMTRVEQAASGQDAVS